MKTRAPKMPKTSNKVVSLEQKSVIKKKHTLTKKKGKTQVKEGKTVFPVLKSKDKIKTDSEDSPVSLDIKKEDQNIVSKPRQTKVKRKLSITNVKDLKPISNIKSLVKKPVKKVSKVQIKNKLETPEKGVCYFSHIPHGFYGKELKKYCSQFGEVTGVYHPVSKNGNSRGYAFVEFKHKEVAEVVAETMNNYLMFNRLVKCQYVPPESQRPWVFKQDRNNMKVADLRRQENLQMQMRNLSKVEVQKWKKRRQMRVKALHKKLAKLGLDYEFQVNDTNEVTAQEEKKNEQ
ncbi:MKI67 FHA domain-interacting nucleolar phosphoprotein-like [Halyomorpha halys]|uniref:MKI67 FHA domain-interacting nucleolar phosphoprotein-like n=1 Tax=Halyomorpha halys TaxID=286706 RepID=UPI0006D4EDA0